MKNQPSSQMQNNADPQLAGAKKDGQSITSDWKHQRTLIEGVQVKEVKNVPKDNGMLTEIFRRDWELDSNEVDQIFQVQIVPDGITAWHVHQFTTDRLFVNQGLIKIVLYDARQSSPTYGTINEFRYGTARPALISVPPGVWHGVHNIGTDVAMLLNIVDHAYRYEDPDHWRLPRDTSEIPYTFKTSKGI